MSRPHNSNAKESFAIVSTSVLFRATNFGRYLRVCADALDELQSLKGLGYSGVTDEVSKMIADAQELNRKLLKE
jgi:hypothetical protein